jgi:hypothetical protein
VDDDGIEQRLIEINEPLAHSPPAAQEDLLQTLVQENAINKEQVSVEDKTPSPSEFQILEVLREVSSDPLSNITKNTKKGVRIRSGLNQMITHYTFVS